jgi:hypothetical protein
MVVRPIRLQACVGADVIRLEGSGSRGDTDRATRLQTPRSERESKACQGRKADRKANNRPADRWPIDPCLPPCRDA